MPSRVPEEFYIGDDPATQKKRKLVKLAAGMAKEIAAKMAARPKPAFTGKGLRLDDEAGKVRNVQKSFLKSRASLALVPGVRKDRAMKALPPVVA